MTEIGFCREYKIWGGGGAKTSGVAWEDGQFFVVAYGCPEFEASRRPITPSEAVEWLDGMIDARRAGVFDRAAAKVVVEELLAEHASA